MNFSTYKNNRPKLRQQIINTFRVIFVNNLKEKMKRIEMSTTFGWFDYFDDSRHEERPGSTKAQK